MLGTIIESITNLLFSIVDNHDIREGEHGGGRRGRGRGGPGRGRPQPRGSTAGQHGQGCTQEVN